MSVSSMFINSSVNSYGIAASAVDGVGNKITMIANAITMGLYTGGGAIIGQCFGARKRERIKKTFAHTIRLSLLIWKGMAIFLVAFSVQIFRIFTADAEVLSLARPYLLIASVMYLGLTLSTGPFALFEGVGNTNLEMVAGMIENLVVKIFFAALFSRYFGLYGYWMGCALAAFVTPAVGFTYFFSGRWSKRKADLAGGEGC